MTIDGQYIAPGEERKIDINIARLPSHSTINISVTVNRSVNQGPVLLLMGALHGDEINGMEIVRRIIENEYNKPECGTIICIPIINVFGFIHLSRYVPDGKDVNRSFPGNKAGSLASRVAHFMTREILPQIDYGIDFHTGGADRTNYPQIRCRLFDEVNRDLANAFAAPFTLDSKYRPKSLRQTAAKMGKNILVYEGGESSRFDEFAIEQGILGTLRLMKKLGMRKEAPAPDFENKIIRSNSWIRARNSGIFLSFVKSGEKVEKRQVIGSLNDPFGEYNVNVVAPNNGYIIGLNNNPIVHQGDALMNLGRPRN